MAAEQDWALRSDGWSMVPRAFSTRGTVVAAKPCGELTYTRASLSNLHWQSLQALCSRSSLILGVLPTPLPFSPMNSSVSFSSYKSRPQEGLPQHPQVRLGSRVTGFTAPCALLQRTYPPVVENKVPNRGSWGTRQPLEKNPCWMNKSEFMIPPDFTKKQALKNYLSEKLSNLHGNGIEVENPSVCNSNSHAVAPMYYKEMW